MQKFLPTKIGLYTTKLQQAIWDGLIDADRVPWAKTQAACH